jgi:hypothetical protein
MPQETGNLTNAVRTKYAAKYIEAAELQRVYDRLAFPVGKLGVENAAFLANSVTLNFLSDMQPGVSTISETTDVSPVTLRDATTTISPTSRYGALQWSEALELKAYTNYGEERFKLLGKNQMESVDLLAQAAALQGAVIQRVPTARSSLDAGTATHRCTDSAFTYADAKLQTLKCPPYLGNGRNQYFAIMHPYAYTDLRLGGNVVTVGQYQAKEIILNWELGQLGPFKLIVTPWAKSFWSAGANNGTAVGTTVATTAPKALDKTMTVAANTNMFNGQVLTVGTLETANTHYPMNERIVVTDASTTTIGLAGEGANGGLRFDHVIGETVSNADNVFPVVFGGPSSIAKLYDESVGEYGEIVGPKRQGLLDQFGSIGWKWYGNYGRIVESWLLRGEFSSSIDA